MLPEGSKPPTNTTELPTDSCASGTDVTTCAVEQNNGAVFRVKLVAEINGNVNAVSTTSDNGPASGTRKRDSDTVDEDAASTSKRCRTSSADDTIKNSLNNAEVSLNNVEEDANVDEDAATTSEVCHTSGLDEQIEAEASLNVVEEDTNVVATNAEGVEEDNDVKQNVKVDRLTVRESVTVSVSVEKSTLNIKTECEDADDEPKPSSSCTSSSNSIKPEVKPAIKVEKADASSTSRESCKFGIRCYRRNPMHRIEEAHPGDHDYKRPSYPPPPDDTPDCPYGDSCYRRNPVHFEQYKHPPDTNFAQNYKDRRMRLRERRQQQLNGTNDDSNNASGNSSDLDDYDLDDPFIDDEGSDYVPSDGVDDDEEDYDECDKAEE